MKENNKMIRNLKINIKRCLLITTFSLVTTGCANISSNISSPDIQYVDELNEKQYIVIDEKIVGNEDCQTTSLDENEKQKEIVKQYYFN